MGEWKYVESSRKRPKAYHFLVDEVVELERLDDVSLELR